MKPYNGFSPEQRMRAFGWLKGEWVAGSRKRPTVCDACGQTRGIIDAHSEDYSEPFGDHIGQFGLCWRCHMMVHVRFSAPRAWTEYRAGIARGWKFPPVYRRDFKRLMAEHVDRTVDPGGHQGERPGRLLLAEIDSGLHRP